MLSKLLVVASAAVGFVNALELTNDNWDEKTAGKSVFIKFLAPWWGHCKSMKPAWDKLMKKFADNEGVLVADVDCTAAGKDLCQTHGVQGYPTIKSGDPSGMEDYQGGRDYDALEKHASSLKPSCSPFNLDLCGDEEKAKIEELMKDDGLDKKIEEEEKKIKDAEENFKKEVEKLQKKYDKLMKGKDEDIKKVKDGGLGLMKAVKAKKAKGGDKEEL